MANDDRQDGRRRGLEGKGFDAGTGYGGAGNASAFSRESSYGGQGENRTDRPGAAPEGAEIPRGTDEQAADTSDRDDSADRSAGRSRDRGRDADQGGADLDGPLGGERREPGR